MQIIKIRPKANPGFVMLVGAVDVNENGIIATQVLTSRDTEQYPWYQAIYGWVDEMYEEPQVIPADEYELIRVDHPNDIEIYNEYSFTERTPC